jgi:hypothetical protein
MPIQYTVDEAKAQLAAQGIQWSDEAEQKLRAAGRIKDIAPPVESMPWYKELGLGVADMGLKAQQVMSPAMPNPADILLRSQTGTTPAEQMTAGAVSGITAGNVNREMLGVPEPSGAVQRGFDLTGQGLGMATAFVPIGGATNVALRSVANPLARRVAGGALGFAGYNALAPAENVADWGGNVLEGAATGGIVGMIPKPVGHGVANAVGRGLVDLGTFTGLGTINKYREGGVGLSDFPQVASESLLESIPQMAGMGVVHGMTNKAEPSLRRTPQESEAELIRMTAESQSAKDAAGYPEQARAEAFRAVKEGRASIYPDPQMKAEAEALRLENERALREQALQEEAAAKKAAADAEKQAQRERTLARVEAQRLAAERASADAEAARQAEIDARLGEIRSKREQNLGIEPTYPQDPMAGPVAPTAGVEPPIRYTDTQPPVMPEVQQRAVESIGTDPNVQYSRTQARIDAMNALRGQQAQPVEQAAERPARDWSYDPDVSRSNGSETIVLKDEMDGVVAKIESDGESYYVSVSEGGKGLTGLDAIEQSMTDVGRTDSIESAKKMADDAIAQASPANEGMTPEQRKLARERMPSGGNLNMGLQNAWEALTKASSRKGKPLNKKWRAVADVFSAPVTEHPSAAPFAKYASGQQDFDATVSEVAKKQLAVRNVGELRQPRDNETPGMADIRETENLSRIKRDMPAVTDYIDQKADSGFRKDVSEQRAGFTDPRRDMQHAADGEMMSALELMTIDGSRQIDTALYTRAEELGSQYADLKKRTGMTSNKDLDIAGKLRNLYNPGTGVPAFLAIPEVRQLMVESGKPRQMLEYVKGTRAMEDQLRDQANRIRKARGLKEIGVIGGDVGKGYLHKQAVKPKFFQVGEKIKRAAAQRGDSRRLSNTSETVNTSATKKRTSTDPNTIDLNGREVAREWNAERVFEGYMDSMLRSIGGDVHLSDSMKLAEYMDIKADRVERNGDQYTADQLRNRANLVRDIAQQQWNHSMSGVGAAADAFFEAGGPIGRVLKSGIAANKRAFDNTKYRLNPKFNLLRQWTSVLNPMFADPVAAALAIKDMGVPGISTDAKRAADAAWESQRKRRPHSTMKEQIEGTGDFGVIKSPQHFERVFIDGLTYGIENWSNRMAFLVEYNSARARKMSPEQRARSAAQAVFKTQSAYTFGERAPVLNSRIIQGLTPAQGYAVELANQIREALGKTGVDSRLYGETRGDQVYRATAIMAAAVMQNVLNNAIVEHLRGNDWREKLDGDSILDAAMALPPFIQVFVPGDQSKSPFLPVSQGVGGVRAVKQTISGDNPLAIPEFVGSNWGGPGGVLASDVMKGQYGDPLGTGDSGSVPGPVTAPRPTRITTTRGRVAPVSVKPKRSGGFR